MLAGDGRVKLIKYLYAVCYQIINQRWYHRFLHAHRSQATDVSGSDCCDAADRADCAGLAVRRQTTGFCSADRVHKRRFVGYCAERSVFSRCLYVLSQTSVTMDCALRRLCGLASCRFYTSVAAQQVAARPVSLD